MHEDTIIEAFSIGTVFEQPVDSESVVSGAGDDSKVSNGNDGAVAGLEESKLN